MICFCGLIKYDEKINITFSGLLSRSRGFNIEDEFVFFINNDGLSGTFFQAKAFIK